MIRSLLSRLRPIIRLTFWIWSRSSGKLKPAPTHCGTLRCLLAVNARSANVSKVSDKQVVYRCRRVFKLAVQAVDDRDHAPLFSYNPLLTIQSAGRVSLVRSREHARV